MNESFPEECFLCGVYFRGDGDDLCSGCQKGYSEKGGWGPHLALTSRIASFSTFIIETGVENFDVDELCSMVRILNRRFSSSEEKNRMVVYLEAEIGRK